MQSSSALYEKAPSLSIGRRKDEQIPTRLNQVSISPCTPLESYSSAPSVFGVDIDLRIKRDDLYPLDGGGTKARKMQYIMRDVLAHGHDVIVTNGGPQSNHLRAAALMAARTGIGCHVVIVTEPGNRCTITGNLLLIRMSGAIIEYCQRSELAERMDQAVENYRESGHSPAYLWGGGHCHAGTVALVEAAAETRLQCGPWIPDYLVHASGTGTTQAGLVVGYADLPTRIIGISVARDTDRGSRVIRQTISEYLDMIGGPDLNATVDFRDHWTCGGYEKTNVGLMAVIEDAAKTGLILDPTYSGKAFYGLIGLARAGEIPCGSKVLFWHTGGLMNLMASSLARGHVTP